MTTFITGATGYLGSYVLDVMMRESDERVAVLTRAKGQADGIEKLWRGLQQHMDADTFRSFLPRIELVPGDLTATDLGIEASQYERLTRECDSVLHIAASLNRKSEKACLNHNLRGTLSVIEFARAAKDVSGLRRFSHVSTVAVAGQRDREVVQEDEAIDWARSDYDPYARTKKFAEHMVRRLLPDVPKTFLRPSIVMGDSRTAETSQFDMVRAFCVLADMPILPFRSDVRLDIVNADWVGRAIAKIHAKDVTKHEIYHLSAGESACTARQITEALTAGNARRAPRFVPALEGPFGSAMNQLAGMKRRNTLTLIGSLFKVFLPYITYDTVFDNSRAVDEVGVAPVPFIEYAGALYRFAKGVNYKYPYRPLPAASVEEAA